MSPAGRTSTRSGDGGPEARSLPAELIEGLRRDFPGHQPGTRPVHSFGVVATGRFRPNDVAGRLTTAAPFTDPDGVRVTARFSNGTANQGTSDARPDVRGMAVRMHGDAGADFDMVCMTLPVFFVRTVEGFRQLTKAAEPPVPPVPRPWWRDLVDQLNLRTPIDDPAPGDAGVIAFSTEVPECCPTVAASFNTRGTESFATRSYHPVHAYRLTNAESASCWVRFHWEPVAGVRNCATTAELFLQRELRVRVEDRPVEFVLRAQVADQGDDLSDPTRPWPSTRRRLVLGHLTLDAVEGDAGQRFAVATGEELEFNPANLPIGIDAHPADEIFWTRRGVYRTSAELRKGLRCTAAAGEEAARDQPS